MPTSNNSTSSTTVSPPGRVDSHHRRHAKLGVLTAWNDDPGTRREDVLDLLDRAVGRTVVGACEAL